MNPELTLNAMQDETLESSSDDDNDSLFDEPNGSSDADGGVRTSDPATEDIEWLLSDTKHGIGVASPLSADGIEPARLVAPSIQGLYFNPEGVISQKYAAELFQTCKGAYFRDPDVNQVMLFERVLSSPEASSPDASTQIPPSR